MNPQEMTDYQLVIAIQEGDTHYMEEVHRRYLPMIMKHRNRTFAKFQSDFSLQDDFESEAYLKLYEAVQYVKREKIYTPDTWKLMQVASWYLADLAGEFRRKIIDAYKYIEYEDLSESQYEASQSMGIYQRHDPSTSEYRIRKFWASLNERQATILRMVQQGQSLPQIATELGLTYPQVQGSVWEVKRRIVPKVFEKQIRIA